MRELTGHKINECNDAITITVLDDPGQGGACHDYCIQMPDGTHVTLLFHKGSVAEGQPDFPGVTHEVLIAILIDRMMGFQTGKYANQYNHEALDHLRFALAALERRTKARVARGVEGTHAV